MSTLQAIETLMGEIGPFLALSEVFAYADAPAWGLVFDAETRFDAEYDARLNRIVLTAPIAPLAPASESASLALYEALLQYNAAWAHSGGARMALAGDTGTVVMLFDLPAADLHLGLLAEVLGNMTRVQKAWRAILQRGA